MKITPAEREEWSAALELALADLAPDMRPARIAHTLTLIGEGVIDAGGIFLASDQTGLCGVQICVPLAGGGGLFWLPRTRSRNAALEEDLVQHGLDWLRSRGTKVAQALLSPADQSAVGPLLRRGFRFATHLNYMEHPLTSVPSKRLTDIRYLSYSAAIAHAFQQTLLRTYMGTLDCPELNGVRSIDEIMAGHMAQGSFRPERWWLILAEEQPVAVALATQVPDADHWDLCYLGVVPEARGHGLGRDLTCHVLQAAHCAGAPVVTLAVDERNRPARQLYRSLGFENLDSREVYLYFWDGPLAGESFMAARST